MLKLIISTRERKRDKRKARKAREIEKLDNETKVVYSVVSRIDMMRDGINSPDPAKRPTAEALSFQNYRYLSDKQKSSQPLSAAEASALVEYQAYYGPIDRYSNSNENMIVCAVMYGDHCKENPCKTALDGDFVESMSFRKLTGQ